MGRWEDREEWEEATLFELRGMDPIERIAHLLFLICGELVMMNEKMNEDIL